MADLVTVEALLVLVGIRLEISLVLVVFDLAVLALALEHGDVH